VAVTEEIIAALRAEGQAAFRRAMDDSADSVAKVGDAAEKSGKQVESSGGEATKATPRWKTMGKTIAKWAGGAAALYGAKRGLEASFSATQDLAKSTMTLQRATGLDARTASAWATVTKARGIQTKQLQVGLVKFNKTITGAKQGTKSAVAAFEQLGIRQDQVTSSNPADVIMMVADSFEKMTDPAQKAALAQQLFGKQGQTLLPLLNSGSKGLQDQLNMAEKYGAVIGDKGVGSAKQMIAQQREMQIAMEGVKVSLGTALLPVLTSLSQVLLRVTQVMQPLLRDSTTVKVVIAAVTAAFVAYKIAIIASTIATLGFNAAILLIPLAVIAVGAAFVIAYKKVGWFRDAVNAVFNWIKGNWPLLLAILTGPIGTAVILIVKNFDKIKSAASAAASFVANRFRDLINFFKRLPGAILGAIGDLGSKIADKLNPGGVIGKATGLLGKITGRQYGGMVRAGETTLVGERGPELLTLPGGSRITPLAPAVAGATHTTAHFYLDRRLVATAVAQADADQRARR